VGEDDPEARTDERGFFGTVGRAVVDVELVWNAAFVKGLAKGFDERVGIVVEEEFAVAADARCVVDEGDEFGLEVFGAQADKLLLAEL
jgi:hypothetical protein